MLEPPAPARFGAGWGVERGVVAGLKGFGRLAEGGVLEAAGEEADDEDEDWDAEGCLFPFSAG